MSKGALLPPSRHPAQAMLLATATLLAACSSPIEAAPPPDPQPVTGDLAFPGAVGHGAGSAGGRGGRVFIVDTLADAGEGSLRACIEANGPRTCVFRVSGVIRFSGRPPMIRNPYITIAGQTAPGGGIVLAHSGGPLGRTPLIIKDTHDVVIRHIRVRPDRIGENRQSEDAFTIENSDNVILDHVSGSWARDELVNGYGDNDRITISNSVFAYGIPRHDKCALLASDPVDAQRVSFIGNICAHNGDRNPDLNFPPGSCVEVVNNILYNAQSQFAEIWEQFGGTPVALIGNYFKGGPNTGSHTIAIARNRLGATGSAAIYLWQNAFEGSFVQTTPFVDEVTMPQPACPPTVRPMSAEQAYEAVLNLAGALPRDQLDRRVVEEVRNGTGRIVREPGQMPSIAAGHPYPDEDRDGIDDRWEATHGSDPESPDPWEDADGDGLANLDAFLEHLHSRLVAAVGQ